MSDASPSPPVTIDRYTIIVLRRRIEAVIREMTNTLFYSGRSGVLNTAQDFSCSIADRNNQTLSAALGVPMHLGCIHLIPQAIVKKFGDNINPGDCFASNDPYQGNTHCADLTLCSPVFVNGKLLFYSIARAHLADIGFPTPTTYSPATRDYYEEGLTLPCVRIQRNYENVPEVLDICCANIRGPDHFMGDYLAILAAVRIGERRLTEIADAYGADVLETFFEEFQTYGERMAEAAIRRLPKGKVSGEVRYDSDLDTYPDGIPVRASLEVDPEAGLITVDLLDNVDNLPLGINMTEATVTASCYTAVLSVLGRDVPRCSGAYRRVRLLIREGAAIGKPKFPAATSAATTNLTHLITSHIQALFAQIGPNLGVAYASIGQPASAPCVSGTDPRAGGRSYFNQIILGFWGGPALAGHDGWLTFASAGAQGMISQSSVEIVEQQQPIIVERLEAREDSEGAGEWCGSPGSICVIRPRTSSVRCIATGAGRSFPPQGIVSGGAGSGNWAWKIRPDGKRDLLPTVLDESFEPGEALLSYGCGGGGYGNPLQRPIEKVAAQARSGLISASRAANVYGVVLKVVGGNAEVDVAATADRRAQLKRRTDAPIATTERAGAQP